MTLFFEADRRFNARPGIHRDKTMIRFWWGYFAVGWIRVPFEKFAQTAYGWDRHGR